MDKKQIETIATIAVPIIVLFLGWYILHKFFSGVSSAVGGATDGLGLTRSDEQASASRKAIENITVSGKQSLTLNEVMNMANTLHNAFKGIGTDTDTAKQVFSRLSNQDDFNYLIRAFGVRDGMNIFDYTRDELPQSSYLRLAVDDINATLKRKGITKNLF